MTKINSFDFRKQRLSGYCYGGCEFQARSHKAFMKRSVTFWVALMMVCLGAVSAAAQTLGGTGHTNDAPSARIAKLEQAVADAKS